MHLATLSHKDRERCLLGGMSEVGGCRIAVVWAPLGAKKKGDVPDFITSFVGWSVIIDYQLVISLFQQLIVTQLRIMEWYSSLTARQTVNVLSWLILPCHLQMIRKEKIMYRLTLHEELWVSTSGIALRASSTAIPIVETHPFRGQSLYMKKIAKA